MRTVIRLNTFETNSSSSHALGLMSVKDFDKWNNHSLGIFLNYSSFDIVEAPTTWTDLMQIYFQYDCDDVAMDLERFAIGSYGSLPKDQPSTYHAYKEWLEYNTEVRLEYMFIPDVHTFESLGAYQTAFDAIYEQPTVDTLKFENRDVKVLLVSGFM